MNINDWEIKEIEKLYKSIFKDDNYGIISIYAFIYEVIELRKKRDKLLVDSDWSQGADIPTDLKTSYVTYRSNLRDLPTTISKPDFDTLNGQEVNKWIEDINSSMPDNPKE